LSDASRVFEEETIRHEILLHLLFGFFVKQQNVNVFHLQGLFVAVGEFGIFLVWFVAGDYLDLLYVLPVAVCVNGFL
jgi:hypothetical protein